MRADPTCEPHLSPTRLGSWSDPAKPWTCFQQSACRVRDWDQSARELLRSPIIAEQIQRPAKAVSVSFIKVQKSHSPAKFRYRQGYSLAGADLETARRMLVVLHLHPVLRPARLIRAIDALMSARRDVFLARDISARSEQIE
jgi:hypothetical protein